MHAGLCLRNFVRRFAPLERRGPMHRPREPSRSSYFTRSQPRVLARSRGLAFARGLRCTRTWRPPTCNWSRSHHCTSHTRPHLASLHGEYALMLNGSPQRTDDLCVTLQATIVADASRRFLSSSLFLLPAISFAHGAFERRLAHPWPPIHASILAAHTSRRVPCYPSAHTHRLGRSRFRSPPDPVTDPAPPSIR